MPTSDELEELGNTAVTRKSDVDLEDDEAVPRRDHLQMVVLGNGTFATHPLRQGTEHTLGRDPRCDIKIADKSISRRHAILRLGDVLSIEDLGSANGTYIRGKRVKSGNRIAINVGELVSLGDVSLILQRRSRPVRPRRLWTHDYFEARLEEECARAHRAGTPFALLRFYPDRRAPESFIEETLAELLRDSDILGKYGPHEYEVLLPDTPPSNAEEAVRRIESVLIERGLKCRVLLACCPRDGYSPYQLAARVQASKNGVPSPSGDIVVTDPQMQSLHRMIEQIAGSNIGVLILGETGVGKEVFARAVHVASPRASGPFVEINCAALTETLLESELFGHEKGAFTNAVAAKPGLIEMAHGGTLLLDEIGEMPLATQAKLLRVIEESVLRRVGGVKERTIDVRFVAATNADLEGLIATGAFRRDLFYRLNAVTIVIPPLRERTSEIGPLARAFIARARSRMPGPPPQLTEEALELLCGYSWPGNVRELRNVVERAVLLSDGGSIRPEHLPVEKMRAIVMTRTISRLPRDANEEHQRIEQALAQANGNQTQAARLLGISRRTLVNRLNEFGDIHRPRKSKKRPKTSDPD